MNNRDASREDLTLEFMSSCAHLERLLRQTSDEAFRATSPEPGRTSSIGAHVRHCLDHLEALAAAAQRGAVCYDRRRREELLERSPRAALARLLELRAAVLSALGPGGGERPLRLEALVESSSPRSVQVPTTLERELLFVTAHTVHHLALIKVLAAEAGLSLPADFGKALSTRAHELRPAPGAA